MAVVGNAYVIVQAVTTGFSKQVEDAIKKVNASSAGANVGQSFAKGFSSSGVTRGMSSLRKEMEAARLKFMQLIRASYFLGPAFAVAAGAIGALASGLFALGAQAAAAAPALIVLPSIMSALGQAAITAKLAFGGIGKAISSLTKKSAGVDRMPAALERLTAAQERLDSAEKRAKKTRDALTKAYEEAREEIEQLNFSAEDAAINEKKAALELEKARETLARVQDLPPNSRARKEAELAFAEAELNLRKAKDANSDLRKEQDRVTANGTRTMDEQIRNMDSYKDAVEANTDASNDLKKAQREEAKAAKEVADIKAGKGGGGGGAEDPMEGLSPEAKKFAEYIAGLKPKLQELRAAAGRSLFPQLEIAIQNLVDKLFPRLLPNLEKTGDALGKVAIKISETITTSENLDKIDQVFKTNNDTIEKGGTIVGNLLDTFLSLLAAADPLIQRFTDWLVVLTDGWKETAQANLESGKLTETFEYAGDVAAQLGRIFGNIGRALMDIGTSAAGPGSGGQMLLDMFEGATEKFQAFIDRAQEGGKLEQYFRDVATNVGAIGRFFVEIIEQILRLGDRKEVGTFADSLTRATEKVGEMLDIFMGGSPALGEFIEKLADLLLKFTETGSIEMFFDIINKALDVLNVVFGNPMVIKIVGVLAIIKAAFIAFNTLFTVARFYALAVGGTVLKVGDLVKKSISIAGASATAFKNMAGNFKAARSMGLGFFQSLKMTLQYTKLGAAATKVWTGVQAAFNAVMAMNPIVLIAIAVAALIAAFVLLYMKVEGFREVVDAVFGFVLDVIKGVWNWISENWKLLLLIIGAPFIIVGAIIQKALEVVLNALKGPWNWVKEQWGKLKDLLSGPINLAKDLIKGYFNLVLGFVKIPFNWLVNNWNRIRSIMTGPIEAIKSAFTGLKDSLVGIFKSVINFLIRGWNGIQFKIPGFKIGNIGFDGFTLKLPQIPELAAGGIVQPSYGGTLARIAEAGRAERIEPLDPDGLSKRDKAMIKLLAGPAGGIQVTVNPSPGMDEVELASLVSRQIAKQIRRGAA
ncbi:tape measure protein [Actinomycetia phage DSL-LC01]|nr:tape measure protein [Actinomycetia phage DSL-LC01]